MIMRRFFILIFWLGAVGGIFFRQRQLNDRNNRLRDETITHYWHAAPVTALALDQRADKTFVTIELPNLARVRVTASQYFIAQPGDRLWFTGQPDWPVSPEPGEFDYGQWLIRQGLSGTARNGLERSDQPIDRRLWLPRLLFIWRRQIISQIRQLLPEPEAGFLAGLLIGSRAGLPAATTEELRRTGTSHIIAVSGANVVIVASSTLWLARFVLFRARPAFWFTQIVIWIFVLLTGASAAAVRGGLAATVMITARHYGRAPPAGSILGLTATVMLLQNPYIYFDVGWQLSMAAFAGLLYFGAVLSENPYFQKLPPVIRGSAAETTAASLATMPISMASFGTFSLTGLVANPLILWLIPIATFAGLAGLLTQQISPSLWLPARIIAWLPLHLILALVHLLSPVPLAWQL